MEIVRELREIPNLSLALGFFDGVHAGHQAVISCAVDFVEINSVQLEEQMVLTIKSGVEYCASPNENIDSELIVQQLDFYPRFLIRVEHLQLLYLYIYHHL